MLPRILCRSYASGGYVNIYLRPSGHPGGGLCYVNLINRGATNLAIQLIITGNKLLILNYIHSGVLIDAALTSFIN
jgi:hypothetical protein